MKDQSGNGKAEPCKTSQDQIAMVDSTGICLFTSAAWGTDELQQQISAACGDDWTSERLLDTGERIWNLERVFNLQAGLGRADDTLPPRLLCAAGTIRVDRRTPHWSAWVYLNTVRISITLGGAMIRLLPTGETGNRFTHEIDTGLTLNTLFTQLGVQGEQRLSRESESTQRNPQPPRTNKSAASGSSALQRRGHQATCAINCTFSASIRSTCITKLRNITCVT